MSKEESKKVFESTFRDWFADRMGDFSAALKSGKDPEVTFSVKADGIPEVTCQIRLIDLPTVFTREGIPIEIIESGRSDTND